MEQSDPITVITTSLFGTLFYKNMFSMWHSPVSSISIWLYHILWLAYIRSIEDLVFWSSYTDVSMTVYSYICHETNYVPVTSSVDIFSVSCRNSTKYE